MTINEILEYVMQTPGNTNRAVLKDMLGQIATAGNTSEQGGFVVTFSPVESEEIFVAVADKTYSEIIAAYENQQVIGKLQGGEDFILYSLPAVLTDDAIAFIFPIIEDFIDTNGERLEVFVISINNLNQVYTFQERLINQNNIDEPSGDNDAIVVTIEENNEVVA